MIHKVAIAPIAHSTSKHTAGSTPATTGSTILLADDEALLLSGITILTEGLILLGTEASLLMMAEGVLLAITVGIVEMNVETLVICGSICETDKVPTYELIRVVDEEQGNEYM